MIWIILIIASPLMRIQGTDIHQVKYIMASKDIYYSESSCMKARDKYQSLDGVSEAVCLECQLTLKKG